MWYICPSIQFARSALTPTTLQVRTADSSRPTQPHSALGTRRATSLHSACCAAIDYPIVFTLGEVSNRPRRSQAYNTRASYLFVRWERLVNIAGIHWVILTVTVLVLDHTMMTSLLFSPVHAADHLTAAIFAALSRRTCCIFRLQAHQP